MRLELFDFLKKRRTESQAPERITVPSDTRVYAIGDVHGRVDLLDVIHATIKKDAAENRADRNVIIYLGDYVDRGLDSRGVLDRITSHPLAGFETVFLKGNHEAMLLEFLEDISVGPSWMAIGGIATLLSYGVATPTGKTRADEFERIQEAFQSSLPAEHLRFLRSLDLTHCEGDYQFVHAGVRPGIALEHQVERDLIWIREPFLSSNKWHGKMIVHGHSIEWNPQVLDNRIGIDTAAYASGRLSCLVLSKRERAFIFAES